MLLGLHVRVELVLPVEALVADAADEGPDPAVHHLVPGEVRGVRELLVARLAGVGLLPRVLPHVLVEVAPVLEGLVAVGAAHLAAPALLLVLSTGRGLGLAPRLVPGGLAALDDVHEQGQSALLPPAVAAGAVVRVLLLVLLALPVVPGFFHRVGGRPARE